MEFRLGCVHEKKSPNGDGNFLELTVTRKERPIHLADFVGGKATTYSGQAGGGVDYLIEAGEDNDSVYLVLKDGRQKLWMVRSVAKGQFLGLGPRDQGFEAYEIKSFD